MLNLWLIELYNCLKVCLFLWGLKVCLNSIKHIISQYFRVPYSISHWGPKFLETALQTTHNYVHKHNGHVLINTIRNYFCVNTCLVCGYHTHHHVQLCYYYTSWTIMYLLHIIMVSRCISWAVFFPQNYHLHSWAVGINDWLGFESH